MHRIFALVALTIAFAPAVGWAAEPNESEALAAVRKAIDKGNAQWSEGWAKGDAAMVAALFAEDGVQLTGSGKVIKGPEQIRERQKAAMASPAQSPATGVGPHSYDLRFGSSMDLALVSFFFSLPEVFSVFLLARAPTPLSDREAHSQRH